MIATEGKQREYMNEWSPCCNLMVVKIGGLDGSVDTLDTQASCIKLSVTLK